MESCDVAILGAGPAGATCALALRESGLRVALIDKARFPRDKVCGDAIGGRATRVLREVFPVAADELTKRPFAVKAAGWRLVTPNGREVRAHFVKPGLVARRTDFDGFLWDMVPQAFPEVMLRSEWSVDRIARAADGILLEGPRGSIMARMLVGCDGANSLAARVLTGRKLDPGHHSGAVRAYYQGVRGTRNSELLEIYLVKGFLPGYFWIFPLPDGATNVGFGMLTRDISRKRIDLRKSLDQIIASNPELKERFQGATRTSEVAGFGLPLGGRTNVAVSGDAFLLCGDAAALIDPLNGEGIANAMWSGQIAARHVLNAFRRDDFSAELLQAYDAELRTKLVPELRRKLRMQRVFNRPWLIESLVGLGNKIPWLKDRVARRL